MPSARLSPAWDDFIMNMKKVQYSQREIARKLGVSEGTIRYRIKRKQLGKEDRRKCKPSALDDFRAVIGQWITDYKDSQRRPTLKTLYSWLCRDHGCKSSYNAFRRYVRKHFPEFHQKRAWVRIEAPPGCLLFVDWKEDVLVQIWEPGHWVKVQALCFTLGFSRKMVVCLSEKKDLAAFIHSHQRAFREFGGLPEVIRTDCLKSAIVKWRSRHSVVNESYRRYLSELGIRVFPAWPRKLQDKGKMEKRIRDLFCRMDFKHRVFRDMSDLQENLDQELQEMEREWRCGATGLSVEESFFYEKEYLREMPIDFPSFPLREKRSTGRGDGLVYFDGKYYQLDGEYRLRRVLCINTGERVTIYHQGQVIGQFPLYSRNQGHGDAL